MSQDIEQLKTCRKCGETRPRNDFPRKKSTADGRCSTCKICNRARAIVWYSENKERAIASRKEYHSRNRAMILDAMADYRRANKSKLMAKQKEWREKNPDRKRANDLKWQAENPEQVKLFRRVTEQKRRAAKRASSGSHTAKDIQQLYAAQCGHCVYCGCSLSHGYHIDHIMPLCRGGSNSIDNIQLLCQPCNNKKAGKDPIAYLREVQATQRLKGLTPEV